MSSRAIQKFFISNLSWTISSRELRNYMNDFGRVLSANVVFDKKTGVSKGFGFVVFNNKSAIENLEKKQKHVLENQTIFIQKSS